MTLVLAMHRQSFTWIFFMNKFSLFSLIILLMSPTLCLSERVTININATVIERSCTISNESLNLSIALQSGDLRQSRIGVPFAGTPFSISLIDCPANIGSAQITFSGESDTTMNNLLKNRLDDDSAAQGVALGLYDTEKNVIDIKNNAETIRINHDQAVNTFNFLAYYVKTNEMATPGKIMSIADFELAYD